MALVGGKIQIRTINIDLVPADEERRASRIAVFE